MSNLINLDRPVEEWTETAMWWIGTVGLIIGLYSLSKQPVSPGLFAAVFILPFMAWGASRSFRIAKLEQKIAELEEGNADD